MNSKFKRGQFVHVKGHDHSIRCKVIEVKPGFFGKFKYKVLVAKKSGRIYTYKEEQLTLSKEQRWVF
jgi:hypothetical protein